MAFHFARSPSKWPRLAICPGSNRMSKGLPDEPGPHALFGTQAHAIGEAMLKGQPYDMLPRDADETRAQQQVIMASQFADYVRTIAGGDAFYSELQVPIATYTAETGATGTLDAALFCAAPDLGPDAIEMVIVDFKTGHHRVSPDSWQMYGYAFGMEDYSTRLLAAAGARLARVRLVIYQPPHGGPSQYVPRMEEYQSKKKEIRVLMARVDEAERASPDNIVYHLRASEEGCRYCPAAKALACPARAAWMDNYVRGVDHSRATLPVQSADMATLDRWYAGIPILQQFIKDVESQMRSRVESGHVSTSAKLVMGREGNRKYSDAQAALSAAVSSGAPIGHIVITSLLSPALLEIFARDYAAVNGLPKGQLPMWWHDVQPYIVRDPATPTLAAIDDDRPPVSATRLTFTDLTPKLESALPPGFVSGSLF